MKKEKETLIKFPEDDKAPWAKGKLKHVRNESIVVKKPKKKKNS